MKQKKFFKILTSFMAVVMIMASMPMMAFAAEDTNTWIEIAPMVTTTMNLRSLILDNKIYVFGSKYINEYDPTTNIWIQKSAMSDRRWGCSADVIDGKVYVFGGAGKAGGTIKEFNPEKDEWTKEIACSDRIGFESVVLNNKIYYIGGEDTTSVTEYDPRTNTISEKAEISVPRGGFKAVTINGKIYALGGIHNNDCKYLTFYSSMEEYDPNTDTWVKKAAMPNEISSFNAIVYNGKILVFGGRNSRGYLSDVEEYDPQKDQWTKKAAMPAARAGMQLQVVNGKVYAFGGNNPDSHSDLYIYDIANNTWSTGPSMLKARAKASFTSQQIDGRIYAIGGDNLSVEMYDTHSSKTPTLTVTASSNKVHVNQKFTTEVAVHNGTNICAEDIKVTYDPDLFEYEGVQADDGLKIYKEDKSTPGTLRFIAACEGKDNAATGDKNLFHLIFTAKKPGTGKVDITRGRIADNATLEEDVTEENCGEDTITIEEVNDVNRSGEFTLLDLGIDAYYKGMNAADTDTTKYNADIVVDGVIDDKDLTKITKDILANTNYAPNN